MGPKTPEKKRARKEPDSETHYIGRKGVKWRRDRTRCVVEMRPPQWKKKLQFGSYFSKEKAMVARDYGAFLRVCAGEKVPDAGGFAPRDQPKLYYFEESPGIFESMAQTKERRASFVRLYPQMVAEKWTGDPPHLLFCNLAREDIAVAITLFRERHPHLLATDSASTSTSPPPLSSPWANLVELPPAQIAVAMDGSPSRILVNIQVPLLQDLHILRIFTVYIQGVTVELNKAAQLEKLLHDLPPCTFDPASIPDIDDPASIPAIDDPESKM